MPETPRHYVRFPYKGCRPCLGPCGKMRMSLGRGDRFCKDCRRRNEKYFRKREYISLKEHLKEQ